MDTLPVPSPSQSSGSSSEAQRGPTPYLQTQVNSMAALAVGNAAALQEQYVAEQKILMKSYNDYLSIEEVGKDLILYAAGNDALAPLKKQYIGFGHSTVLSMINHLCQKTAIKMTTVQKHKYKVTSYNSPWDPTTSITAYFTQLDRFQVSLGNRGIATSDAEKTMVAGAQMWQREMFTEDQMVTWENKPATQQTWAKLQIYFAKKWLDCKQYSAMTAKQSHFKEATLLAQETAAAEEEGESSNVVCNAARTAHQANCSDDSHKQGQHGCHDGKDDCTGDRWSRKMPNSSTQREHPCCREQPPHINKIKSNPAQETQETQVHVSPLQKFCSSQTQKLC
jgi:hypothetical protein